MGLFRLENPPKEKKTTPAAPVARREGQPANQNSPKKGRHS
ncbi:hypothetical protein FF36_00169 [Frankia torreyi]|uniref:Uncharacterized protein n=1 Tax=Frankia torreyi TaxID=1856 RepID=A0A0D8BMV9_9ACTN|nr:hypothetical protein [Frankia torreyi]KJE25553.1 hypothetical protein FF36_00169 [Frankia torreyi]KQM06197.1 hypothetical protein FF86_101074 [Frankia sp. CpI1-P]